MTTEIIRVAVTLGASVDGQLPAAVRWPGATSEIISRMAEQHTTKGQRARDVLAAEEFGVPAPDPALNHGPIRLPDDPTGIAEAHDVLAAEEFAMPAPRHMGATPEATPRGSLRSRAALVLGGAIAFAVLLRRRRG